jgi:hypothetical protein
MISWPPEIEIAPSIVVMIPFPAVSQIPIGWMYSRYNVIHSVPVTVMMVLR